MPAEFEQEQRLREMERKDLLRLQGIDDEGGFDQAHYNVGQSYGRQVEWGGPPSHDSKNYDNNSNDKIDLSDGVLLNLEKEESKVNHNR